MKVKKGEILIRTIKEVVFSIANASPDVARDISSVIFFFLVPLFSLSSPLPLATDFCLATGCLFGLRAMFWMSSWLPVVVFPSLKQTGEPSLPIQGKAFHHGNRNYYWKNLLYPG